MASPAELSSIATALEELQTRITAAAETYRSGPREDVSHDLFDVERHLRTAHRRLSKALETLA